MKNIHEKILLVFLTALFAQTEAAPNADPDFLSSGMSWTIEGVPSLKIGDRMVFDHVEIGVMFEGRNEKRFNQVVFPNHNWRGVGKVEGVIWTRAIDSSHLFVSLHMGHESAHSTMGIRVSTQKAFELVYDDAYRRMILNSTGVSGRYSMTSSRNDFFAELNYHFYFLSKNTPELAGSTLGTSNGFSIGIEDRFRINPTLSLFVSLYDRIVLQGFDNDVGAVYVGDDNLLINNPITYQIIAQTNTFVIKSGISFNFSELNRELSIFGKVLSGNPYGFVDSRDTRLEVFVGIETFLK